VVDGAEEYPPFEAEEAVPALALLLRVALLPFEASGCGGVEERVAGGNRRDDRGRDALGMVIPEGSRSQPGTLIGVGPRLCRRSESSTLIGVGPGLRRLPRIPLERKFQEFSFYSGGHDV